MISSVAAGRSGPDKWVAPLVGTEGMNVDGIHWGWQRHQAVGAAAAELLGGQRGIITDVSIRDLLLIRPH
jgi:hypothetical protein